MRKNGFTLVEAIVVIAILLILGGLLTPIVSNQLTNKKIEVTEEKLKKIKKAIIGDPSVVQFGQRTDFGYVGDMGNLPSSLLDLIVQGTQPGWQYYTNVGPYTEVNLGAGWRGPYLDPTRYPNGKYESLLDGWGRDFVYESPGGNIARRIRSYGPDGASGACGNDDICIDIFFDEWRSFLVQGNTWDQCGTGIQYQQIVFFYAYNGGIGYLIHTPTPAPWFSISGANIPIGLRRIFADTQVDATINHDLKQFLVISNGPAISINLKKPGSCTAGSP